MAVVFSLIFGRFALVFIAFCLYVAVPLARFSTIVFSLFLAVLSIVAVFFFLGGLERVFFFFWGGVRGIVITSCRLRFT